MHAKWLTERDMLDIRYGMNNFMRTAHYPHMPAVYDFNDRHGIITVEEVPNNKAIDFDREVQKHNMREMVRRDRNHPRFSFERRQRNLERRGFPLDPRGGLRA